MAVLQISKIQHRRGLRVDVPVPLNEAEFGFSVDTRELFIGNGPLFPGNTQIITNHTSPGIQLYNYLDKFTYNNILNFTNGLIANTGYLTAAEGGNPSDELIINSRFNTVRSFQEKFDDWVSIKDYGASGDGQTNINADDTGAFWRAAFDMYKEEDNTADSINNPTVDARRRRAIYVPAGIYRIRKWIPLFPFMTLFGDGIGKTIIYYDYAGLNDPTVDPISSVIKTVDSLGQAGSNMGIDLGNGVARYTPQHIQINGVEFRSSAKQPINNTDPLTPYTERQIAELRGISNSRFEYCAFNYVEDVNNPLIISKWSHNDYIIDGTTSISIPDLPTPTNSMKNLSFIGCETNNSAFAFNFIDAVVNVNIERHVFGTHFQDVKIGVDSVYDSLKVQLTTNSSEHIRVVNSRHTNNQDIAFYVTASAGPGHISLANYYSIPVSIHPSRHIDSSNFSTIPSVLFENGSNNNFCSSSLDTFDDFTLYTCDGTQIRSNTRVRNLTLSATVMNATDFYQLPGITDLTICGYLNVIPNSDTGISSAGQLDITTIPYPSTGIAHAGNSIVINYSMRQAGSGAAGALTDLLRIGQFRVIFNENPIGFAIYISYVDDFNESNGPSTNSVNMIAVADDINNQIIIRSIYTATQPTFKYTITSVII